MPNNTLTEEVLQFGDDARLFGILTLPTVPPQQASELPVFVFLSSGLLHRVGPRRLYVRLARALGQMGFSSFRVDLTGRGDSPGKTELRDEQSLVADYREIVSILEARLGQSRLVLGGLCSGADNALVLAQADPRVIGLLLIDPTCYPDDRFELRRFFRRYTDLARYVEWLKRRVARVTGWREPGEHGDELYTSLTIGSLPTREQLRSAFQAICEREGRALSVFTSLAEEECRYNELGQLGRILDLPDYEKYCSERFFATAEHTFDLEQHRRRLLTEIQAWAAGYL